MRTRSNPEAGRFDGLDTLMIGHEVIQLRAGTEKYGEFTESIHRKALSDLQHNLGWGAWVSA